MNMDDIKKALIIPDFGAITQASELSCQEFNSSYYKILSDMIDKIDKANADKIINSKSPDIKLIRIRAVSEKDHYSIAKRMEEAISDIGCADRLKIVGYNVSKDLIINGVSVGYDVLIAQFDSGEYKLTFKTFL